MDTWLRERIRERFPEAEALAFSRLYGRGTVLFDRKHKPRYPEDLIAAVIHIAQSWAFEAGLRLKLIAPEKRIMARYFVLEKMLAWLVSVVLLLSCLYDAIQ
jgi:hypothetical protein